MFFSVKSADSVFLEINKSVMVLITFKNNVEKEL